MNDVAIRTSYVWYNVSVTNFQRSRDAVNVRSQNNNRQIYGAFVCTYLIYVSVLSSHAPSLCCVPLLPRSISMTIARETAHFHASSFSCACQRLIRTHVYKHCLHCCCYFYFGCIAAVKMKCMCRRRLLPSFSIHMLHWSTTTTFVIVICLKVNGI